MRCRPNSLQSSWSQILLLLFVAAGNWPTPSIAEGDLQTVVLSGDQAPGTGEDIVFRGFGSSGSLSALNNEGSVSFAANVDGPGVDESNRLGFWSKTRRDGLLLLAREGDPAPGTEGDVTYFDRGAGFALTSDVSLNNNNETVFRAMATGPGIDTSNDQGIWTNRDGAGLALIGREGSAAPNTASGVTFAGLGVPFLTTSGHSLFSSGLIGPGINSDNDRGIWTDRGGNGLELVVRNGDSAPGVGTAAVFSSIGSFRSHVFNDNGQVAFLGSVSGDSADDTNDFGIWSEGNGNGLVLVARDGTVAPGLSDEVEFNGLGSPVLNDLGQVAFRGVLSGTGVDSTNSVGVWSEGRGNGLSLVARTGDSAPGTNGDIVFSALGYNSPFGGGFFSSQEPVINNLGQTAFHGYLTGLGVDQTNNSGIWSEGGGNGLALVVREGDPAPGTSDGVVFDEINSNLFSTISLNNVGQTAYLGLVSGAGVDTTNNVGVWAQDRVGNLQLIARKGDLLDVDNSPGTDMRQVETLLMSNSLFPSNFPSNGFNDRGQVLFLAHFTDGSSGLFVSNRVAIPEPSCCVMLVVAVSAFTLLGGRSLRRQFD